MTTSVNPSTLWFFNRVSFILGSTRVREKESMVERKWDEGRFKHYTELNDSLVESVSKGCTWLTIPIALAIGWDNGSGKVLWWVGGNTNAYSKGKN